MYSLNIFFPTQDEREFFLNYNELEIKMIDGNKKYYSNIDEINLIKCKSVYKHIPGYWLEVQISNTDQGNKLYNQIFNMVPSDRINEEVFYPKHLTGSKCLNKGWLKKYDLLKNRFKDDVWKIFFQEVKNHLLSGREEIAYYGLLLIFKLNPFFLKKYKRFYIFEEFAYYFEDVGNLGKAIKSLKMQAVLCPESVEPYLNMSSFYIVNGMEKDAINTCVKGLEKNQNNQYLVSNLIIAATNMGDFEYAIAYLQSTLNDDPNNPFFLKLLGDVFYELENNNSAIDCYKKSYEQIKKETIDDLQADICSSLANCYYDNENYKEAVAYYRKSLKYTPSDSFILLTLSQIYFDKLKDVKSALKFTRLLVEKIPENGLGQLQLGLIYSDMKNIEKARWHLYRARQLMPYYLPVQEAINSLKKIK
ncbi:tetratricopeptide repeat protein [Serpentinicella sp. ANB-PHB4]|uniref:tetratricopeptide repeat protein n=1 Tax=Serpentinicella sp. ANB-PHB4 TaxID=3074076 RepID=UPI0028647998|nr:tetratricopeptide repeat protein [Serpentinicella sp. ANB-PHB4]MDR5657957.1 tetratricopeptide repeat protein [Serpentinicella sp. ANB-PHB4]